MADLVRLASSIATLAAAGFHVARKVSTVVDDLGASNAQTRAIAADTEAISVILRDIEGKLLRGKESSRELNQHTRDVLAEVLELCRHEIEGLDQNLAPLKQKDHQQDAVNVWQKAEWLFDKHKAAARQASLDALKRTLNILLHDVQLFEVEIPDVPKTPFVEHGRRLPEQYGANTTVVFLNGRNVDEPLPMYHAEDLHEVKETADDTFTALGETGNRIAGLSGSQVVSDNPAYTMAGIQVLDSPPSNLSEVQQKVRYLAIHEKERREARRTEKAIRIEAWKERKQAKRMARVAWAENRRTVHA